MSATWTPEDEIRALAAFQKWHGPMDSRTPCMPTHPHLSGTVYEREKDAFIAGVWTTLTDTPKGENDGK